MAQYISRRILLMIPTLIAVSIVSFIIIQLPPGDFLTSYAAQLAIMGESPGQQTLVMLRERYGLEQPLYVQYFKWIGGILLHGDFGQSFDWRRPVRDLIWERLALTFMLSLTTMLFTWVIAFPIGIYSAVKQYSIGDYLFTFLGFLGLAIPDFLLALVLMVVAALVFGQSVGGFLMNPQ